MNDNSFQHSTHFSLQRALNFINLLCWTLGFRLPRNTFTNYVPNWSAGEAVVQAVAVAVVGLVLTWRRFRPWRIALVALSAFVTAWELPPPAAPVPRLSDRRHPRLRRPRRPRGGGRPS